MSLGRVTVHRRIASTGRWALWILCAVALLLTARPLAPASAAVAPLGTETDRLLVVPAAGVPIDRLAGALSAAGIEAEPLAPLTGAVAVVVPLGADPASFAQRIAGRLGAPLVSTVESDDIVRAARVPIDPLYQDQQAPYLEAIRAPEAWEIETGSPQVTVAVIDTGVDFTHADLIRRLRLNTRDRAGNGLDDDRNGCIDDQLGCSFVSLETTDPSCGTAPAPPHAAPVDDEGHGTFVAGLIAAAGNDATGIAGVAWDVRILPVKVLDCTATGRVSDAAAGIRYAARSGVDVINISFGSPQPSRTLSAAIDEALASGAVVVAAAGNRPTASIDFPARYPGVIAVGGAGIASLGGTDYDRVAPFSPTGAAVQIFAPATALVAPLPPSRCGERGWVCVDTGTSTRTHAIASGTSFAAPLVAGTAALLRSHRPTASAVMIRALLLNGAAPLTLVGPRAGIPSLRLDVAGALERPVYGRGLPGTSRASGGETQSPR